MGLFFKGVAGFLGGLSWRFWAGVGVLVLIATSILAFNHAIHNAEQRGFKNGEASAYGKVEKKARQIEKKAKALAAKIRSQNSETNRRVARDADDLRLRGPGKASCLNPTPATPRRRVQASRPADAPVAQVSDPERVELIALPFDDAVAFAEEYDLLRAEVLSWRQANEAQQKAWDDTQ